MTDSGIPLISVALFCLTSVLTLSVSTELWHVQWLFSAAPTAAQSPLITVDVIQKPSHLTGCRAQSHGPLYMPLRAELISLCEYVIAAIKNLSSDILLGIWHAHIQMNLWSCHVAWNWNMHVTHTQGHTQGHDERMIPIYFFTSQTFQEWTEDLPSSTIAWYGGWFTWKSYSLFVGESERHCTSSDEKIGSSPFPSVCNPSLMLSSPVSLGLSHIWTALNKSHKVHFLQPLAFAYV